MYRPKGWKEFVSAKTYYNVSTEIYDKKEIELGRRFFARGIEVGADAMLEGLKKEGEHLHNTGTTPSGNIEGRVKKAGYKGWLVFIPEE